MYRLHYFGHTLWWMNGGITCSSDVGWWMTSISMLCRERLSFLFGAGEGRTGLWMEKSHKSIFAAHKRGNVNKEKKGFMTCICARYFFKIFYINARVVRGKTWAQKSMVMRVCMQVWGQIFIFVIAIMDILGRQFAVHIKVYCWLLFSKRIN